MNNEMNEGTFVERRSVPREPNEDEELNELIEDAIVELRSPRQIFSTGEQE